MRVGGSRSGFQGSEPHSSVTHLRASECTIHSWARKSLGRDAPAWLYGPLLILCRGPSFPFPSRPSPKAPPTVLSRSPGLQVGSASLQLPSPQHMPLQLERRRVLGVKRAILPLKVRRSVQVQRHNRRLELALLGTNIARGYYSPHQSCCCCSVHKLVATLHDPMDYSTQGFSVPHHLLEFAQVHVQWISDAILPSHPLLPSSSSAINFSKHQGLFQWVSCSHQWPKYRSFSFSISCSKEYSGLISLKIYWFDLLAFQGTRLLKWLATRV